MFSGLWRLNKFEQHIDKFLKSCGKLGQNSKNIWPFCLRIISCFHSHPVYDIVLLQGQGWPWKPALWPSPGKRAVNLEWRLKTQGGVVSKCNKLVRQWVGKTHSFYLHIKGPFRSGSAEIWWWNSRNEKAMEGQR